ncbi:MAG: hypothetical protein KDA44_09415 [Planctomycetales bacterium]|nr:hypothetical protein [Planctomycetales bacterium]
MAGKTSKSPPAPPAEPPVADRDDLRTNDAPDDDRDHAPATGDWYQRMAVEAPLASPKLLVAVRSHNSEVEKLCEIRGRALRLRNTPDAVALTFDDLCRRRAEICDLDLQAMQTQARLAADRADLLGRYQTELVAGHPAARAELEKAKEAVREELARIGFEASALPVAARHPTPAAQQIEAVVQQHPRYLSAAEKLRAYGSEAIAASSAVAAARKFHEECKLALEEFVAAYLAT